MKREFSAGGVVLREQAGVTEVVVVVPKRGVLALPKGHPDADETLEQAAAREVREESGIVADPVARLGEVRYWYQLHGERVLKTVTFFRFEFRSGDTADHDDEVESAHWMPLADAPDALSYDGEAKMAAKALEWHRGTQSG